MARPKSPEKQAALLYATTQIIATEGVAASTASIAKLAGVAEGTLFRYFANKDILLGAVFDELLKNLRSGLKQAPEPCTSHRQQARNLWDNYVEWCLQQPAAHAAMRQLLASGKLSQGQIEQAMQLGRDTLGRLPQPRFEGLSPAQSAEFIEALLGAIVGSTTSLTGIHPQLKHAYSNAGFKVFWLAATAQEA